MLADPRRDARPDQRRACGTPRRGPGTPAACRGPGVPTGHPQFRGPDPTRHHVRARRTDPMIRLKMSSPGLSDLIERVDHLGRLDLEPLADALAGIIANGVKRALLSGVD